MESCDFHHQLSLLEYRPLKRRAARICPLGTVGLHDLGGLHILINSDNTIGPLVLTIKSVDICCSFVVKSPEFSPVSALYLGNEGLKPCTFLTVT